MCMVYLRSVIKLSVKFQFGQQSSLDGISNNAVTIKIQFSLFMNPLQYLKIKQQDKVRLRKVAFPAALCQTFFLGNCYMTTWQKSVPWSAVTPLNAVAFQVWRTYSIFKFNSFLEPR